MVRLLTHNLLCSNVKGVKNPYPLQIRAEEVEHGDAEYDPVMTLRMIPKIDYGALVMACAAVGHDALPPTPPVDATENEAFLRALHHALFNIEIVRGAFVCPESGREFPIVNGIPNMVLNEDEV